MLEAQSVHCYKLILLPELQSRCSERPLKDLEGTSVISIKEDTGATAQRCAVTLFGLFIVDSQQYHSNNSKVY